MKIWSAILVTLVFVLSACDKKAPAGFWTNYEKELIVQNISDQGPWGGNRVIHWSSETAATFDNEKIIEFANKNNWTIIDSSDYSETDLKEWYDNEKPIFPIILTGFEPIEKDSSSYKDLPRWITNELTVYKFKTNWIVVYPGTDDSTIENGFVIISKDRKEMTVYHLWGG